MRGPSLLSAPTLSPASRGLGQPAAFLRSHLPPPSWSHCTVRNASIPLAPCGIGMSGHPGRTGHLDIRPAERVVGPYGFFLPLRAVTPSSLLQRHPPGSFRGSSPVPASSTAPQSHSQQTGRRAIPTVQKSRETTAGSLQRWGAQPGQRPPREGTAGGSLCQDPGLLQPLVSSQRSSAPA